MLKCHCEEQSDEAISLNFNHLDCFARARNDKRW
jgi:hypothetical protein